MLGTQGPVFSPHTLPLKLGPYFDHQGSLLEVMSTDALIIADFSVLDCNLK